MAYQFTIRKPKGKSEGILYLRYSYKGYNDLWLSTGKRVHDNHWDADKEEPTSKYPGGKITLIRILTKMKGQVMKAAGDLENEGEEPTPEEVKIQYLKNTGGKIKGSNVITEWEQFVEKGKAIKAPITTLNEADSLNTFKEFCKKKKKDNLTLRRITKDLVHEYSVYLNKFAANTKAKRLKHFKAFLKDIKHPATEYVKFKEVPGDKIFLTEEELTALETYNKPDLTPALAKVRDLLVLQCETGLRVSDLMRVGAGHIQGEYLILRAKKNDQTIRMPLSGRAAQILDRYEYVIPRMADQTYNDMIKDVAELAIPKSTVEVTEHRNNQKIKTTCKKWEVLTSHCNVRTFITLAAGRGMPIPSIAALTGKSVQTLLRSYLNPNTEQALKDAITYARPLMAISKTA